MKKYTGTYPVYTKTVKPDGEDYNCLVSGGFEARTKEEANEVINSHYTYDTLGVDRVHMDICHGERAFVVEVMDEDLSERDYFDDTDWKHKPVTEVWVLGSPRSYEDAS